MDILTQGVVGAALPLATRHKKQAAAAAGLGFLAGLAPDLDALIRSSEDTLLFLEFHRHFTHSLFFIPIGSGIVAGLVHLLFRKWITLGFWKIWLFCALGYGTHGLLDAATSFGTSLLWPLSGTRFSFSIISIVDPLFTLPALALVAVGVFRKKGLYGRLALLWAGVYLALAAYQHHQAQDLATKLAESRNHQPARLVVKPTFGNIVLWKSVYEHNGRYYVDAIRPWPGETTFEGTSLATLQIPRDLPWLTPGSRQASDIKRFTSFSDGYVAKAADGSPRIIDVRYSFLPTETQPLWFIQLTPGGAEEARAVYGTDRANAREKLPELWRMITATQ